MGQVVILFHSALGLRPAVREFADRLRAAGHTVYTPDLFDGEIFERLEDGVRKRETIGIPGLIRRAQAAVADLPPQIVLAGFSMGASTAEFLAAKRPGAKATILMHGALAPGAIGLEAWPKVPIQLHYAQHDRWVNIDQVNALEAAVRKAAVPLEVYVYDRVAHLFEDAGLPAYDQLAAQLLLERVLGFLRRLDEEKNK